MATTARNVRIDDDMWQAAKDKAAGEGADASAVVVSLIRGWLAGDAVPTAGDVGTGDATTETAPGGIPSPGAPCATGGCWERNTAKYGLRDLPLCKACAAAAAGLIYWRPETVSLRKIHA